MQPAPLLALLVLLFLGTARAAADDGGGHRDVRPGGSLAALAAARASRAEWVLGELAVRRRRDESVTVRADLRYRGRRVARLRIDPRTGDLLAARERAVGVPAEVLDLVRLREAAERAIRDLDVGEIAWPGEHGRAWRLPLVYHGRVVGRLTVSRADGRLLADDGDDD